MKTSHRIKKCDLHTILLTALLVSMVSCSRSVSYYNRVIDDAEKVAETNADSAAAMLDAIDPAELAVDSVMAMYHYPRA